MTKSLIFPIWDPGELVMFPYMLFYGFGDLLNLALCSCTGVYIAVWLAKFIFPISKITQVEVKATLFS
jgi:hypothetical protein